MAPGYWANINVIADLSDLQTERVFYRGNLVAQDGRALFNADISDNKALTSTVNIRSLSMDALGLRATRETMPVIEIIPGQIITRKGSERVRVIDGLVMTDVDRDILKVAVVERHRASGNIGLGLVTGFGLKDGALASSIAHDSHNIVAVGTNDRDILVAIKEIEKLGGGLVAAAGGRVLASLALPIAGLLSREPLEMVVSQLQELEQAAADLGTGGPSPFSTLSFIALPVIPELRLTDHGLVDVVQFKLL